MSTATDDQFYRRSFALGFFIMVAAAVVVGRLAYLVLKPPPEPPPPPTDEEEVVTFLSERGNIYDGNGYLLSVTHTFSDIAAAPRFLTDTQVLADRLAPVLAKPREELLEKLEQVDEKYVLLKRGVRWEVAREILSWGFHGVQADSWPGRVYPHGPLAACVLGFVTDAGQAFYGIEAEYDERLAGVAGFRKTDEDPLGSLFYQVRAPHDGVDLFLTLDRNVQYVVEEELATAVELNGAEKGIAVVMDPQTGAILAMAVFPTYDPNTREVTDYGVFVNSAISEHYEPGSVFKIVTVASALDAGAISSESTYYDAGEIMVGGEVIKNSDDAAHGETSIPDLIAYSLNVGAAHVSTRLGAFKFYEYVRRFGFNERTGVDLDGEVSGRVRFPGDREWHESDLGTNSFGQGLAVTPLQMLSAVSAVANHGVLMRPYIVERIVDGETVTHIAPEVVRQAVSPETAAQVTEMLVHAVDTVLTAAAIPGYRVAGKSGTSEIPTLTGYDPEETIASFAGYVPADDPRFAILVVLERPQKEHFGLAAAAPAFREIGQRLLRLMAVPADGVRTAMQVR
jgi:cell division protein FtsI (penicillin-binding protein 3)